MKLEEFIKKYDSDLGYLSRQFLSNVYFKDYGELGLDLLTPEVEIGRNDGTDRVWRLDFVVNTKREKYAIECDGFNYHAPGRVSRERFNELERKRNETIRQGYRLLSLSKDQIVDNPQESIYELRRSFNSNEELYNLFLRRVEGNIVPHEVQSEALKSLKDCRDRGQKSGLVVLATGLGKTYLSIFDAINMKSKKILFLVHVEQILKQSRNSFENVMPERADEMGFFTGNNKSAIEGKKKKNIIFSTVQTMCRKENITKFEKDYFDYIIIDESHHTAAESYKKIVSYFEPKFLLGLTATPDRMDRKDILGYYDDNLVYQMDQEEAIKRGYLSKLEYRGFLDNIDYSNIYYNGFRYDVDDLNRYLMIEKRDEAVIKKYLEIAPQLKTIGFCASIEHAEWCAKKFQESGIDAVAIHSKVEDFYSEGAYQSSSEIFEAFDSGNHQVAFVVDMLNEGIDIPDVECILMLRPTESDVVLTQQLGRGLRISDGKEKVLVLDFIGNYRSSTKILYGLGIQRISQLEKDEERDIYFYDNNGKYVEFETYIVDNIFKPIISTSSKTVDKDLLQEEWIQYGNYLKENTEENVNLYWSVGKKINDLDLHFFAMEFISNNKDKFDRNSDLDKALREHIFNNTDQTMEGIRALFLSKLIGLIKKTHPFEFSEAYYNIVENLGSEETFKSLVTNQFEKFYFFNDLFSTLNRHDVESPRKTIGDIFHIYPIFFLYQILMRLSEKGYEKNFLTKFEIEKIILLCRTHEDLNDCIERIIDYRGNDNKLELEKYLNEKSTMDSRFYNILKNIHYFIFNKNQIVLDQKYFSEIQNKVDKFNKLLVEKSLIRFEGEDPEKYKKMLFSEDSLLESCNNT